MVSDTESSQGGSAYVCNRKKLLVLGGTYVLFNLTGPIVICISAHRSVALMPPIVRVFKSLYPGIILKIIEEGRTDLIDTVEHASSISK